MFRILRENRSASFFADVGRADIHSVRADMELGSCRSYDRRHRFLKQEQAMKQLGTSFALWLAAAAGGSAVSGSASADTAPQRPLLLELFTSQSCSSCPPADAVLGELAAHPELLALEFHVDYWNDLGWVDSYSAPEFTARQQQYAAQQGFEVYTPQLVVDGRSAVIGSNRADVAAAISAAQRQARAVPASLSRRGDSAVISVGAGDAHAAKVSADVYLLSFDSHDSVSIHGGENSGRQMSYTNVVRTLRKVGEWHGQPLSLDPPLEAREKGRRLALLVQEKSGAVWATASIAAAD
jgi:hypothetical protein